MAGEDWEDSGGGGVTDHEGPAAWRIVAAGALITWLSMGAFLALPVFLTPMSADTGWSRGGIGLAMTINFLVMGVASFGWGAFSDRYGPRRALVIGVVLMTVGLAWASRASTLLEFQLVWGLVVGTAGGSMMVPLMSTVTLWFERHRALAVSLVSSGVGVAPMTVSPVAAWLVQDMGWRSTQLLLAGAIAIVLLPATLVVRRPPGFVPLTAPSAGGAPRQTVRQALTSMPFIVMSLTFFACCATHAGPIFHTVSYAIGCGLSPMTAVTIYSVEGAAGLVGRLLFGALADAVGIKRMIVIGLLVQALAAGAYALVSQQGEFYAVAFVFGLAYGGVMPLYSALARQYFEPQLMGTVLGGMVLFSGVGMALGPAVGGWIYDSFHAYTWMYAGSLMVGLMAAVIALKLPRAASATASLQPT